MAKKKIKTHSTVHMSARVGAIWAKERKVKRERYKKEVKQGLHKEKVEAVVVPNAPDPRKDPLTIKSIRNQKDVDTAVDCFVWPSKQYDRKADFYIQTVIGTNERLLDYYHKKMTTLFGVEHQLKSNQSRIGKKEYIKIPERQTIRIKEHKTESILVQQKTVVVPVMPQPTTSEPKAWILDWEFVDFYEGFFVVNPPDTGIYAFSPLKVTNSKVRPSFSYIRKYIKEKVPTIFCTIQGGKLTIGSPVLVDEAIATFQKIARQQGLFADTRISKESPETDSFKKALSKAAQMSPEDFKKYKSKFIDYLVSRQSEQYKIIPCTERLVHNYGEAKEYAFLFTIDCASGNILVVFENINPDRSTIVFVVKANSYNKSIRSIYSFLQGDQVNKRSGIREGNVKCEPGIIFYKSIDHDDVDSWRHTIDWYTKVSDI